jgi:ribosomal protein S12 methylthiotransferase
MKEKSGKISVSIISLGCSKNTVDSEVLLKQLDAAGFTLLSEENAYNASAIIINTCGFINDAKQESIDTILEFVEEKKKGKVKKVIVMGCLSQRYKDELLNAIPGIDGCFGVNSFQEIMQQFKFDLRNDLLNQRILTTPSHYAYLKIAEGCDRTCSFCAIPSIRGKHVSRTMSSLVEEAEFLADKGVKELILVAQDLTYYGIDIYKKQKLADLLSKLTKIEKVKWIRLHYAYPKGFPMDVLDVIVQHENVCKYLDIPFQHINDELLKSMKRGNNSKQTYALIENIRKKVPGIAIRTSLIVGYPGETKKQFKELCDFVKEMQFDRLGVFTYSHEENTPAFQLKDTVSQKEKEERMLHLMQIQENISFKLNNKKIGKTLKVFIDREEEGVFVGRTEFDSPEIDNEVLIEKTEKQIKRGNFYSVKIKSADSFDLFGTL